MAYLTKQRWAGLLNHIALIRRTMADQTDEIKAPDATGPAATMYQQCDILATMAEELLREHVVLSGEKLPRSREDVAPRPWWKRLIGGGS